MSEIKKRCVIVGAAEINNYDKIHSYLNLDSGQNFNCRMISTENINESNKSEEISDSVEKSEKHSDENSNESNKSGEISDSAETAEKHTDFGINSIGFSTCEHSGDFYIFCDGGLRYRERLGAEPDLIVGDFDSYENPMLAIETIVLPREKDDTDTFFAAKEAVKRGFDEFLLLGVFGQRLDHTLANISILVYLAGLDKKALAVDDYGEYEIVKGSEKPADRKYIDDRFSFFSLISLGGNAKGVSIKHAKFPLTDGTITPGYQYGISNEVLPGEAAEVSLTEGMMLLIRVF